MPPLSAGAANAPQPEPPSKVPKIETQDLQFYYGKVRALTDITLLIAGGYRHVFSGGRRLETRP